MSMQYIIIICMCNFDTLTLTHYVCLCGKEEDEWKKTEGGTEAMISCPDFEPQPRVLWMQATEDR